MRLLSRYVVREHVGPLLFALTALTSLLMLQYVARQLANLAGKGLPWTAIGKFFVLSLPFTVAMTLPMAVLVATLYAFGRMAAEHEITAFKASGVRVRALMAPVLFCALLLSLTMVWFNDQVLPASNHRLRVLQSDIARTKPTLALRDQVLNQLTPSFFMRVARSNATTNRMYDVVIYDLSRGPERKTIYADSGLFSLAPNGEDLQLQLFDGYAQEFSRGDNRKLQRTYFRSQSVRVKDIARSFQTSASDNFKSDREMSVCEMQRKYSESVMEYHRLRDEYVVAASRVLKPGDKGIRVPKLRPTRVGIANFYCNTLPSLVGVKTARAQQPPAVTPATTPPVQPPPAVTPATTPPVQPPAVPTDSTATPPTPQTEFESMATAASVQMLNARASVDGLNVEIQKEFALSFACLVFVLFGPPIALRFPRGGVGVTLGVSIVVFGLYYICLMGGETLADQGRLPPPVAMWIANVVFAIVGLILLWRVESTTDTSRGGGIRDWLADRKARKALRSGASA
ncbi:MAG TPA: LptF/LptG family permease [Gemmatimonas sp.]|nr:LptF/LptG family permease [Gemmatimonas sp.]